MAQPTPPLPPPPCRPAGFRKHFLSRLSVGSARPSRPPFFSAFQAGSQFCSLTVTTVAFEKRTFLCSCHETFCRTPPHRRLKAGGLPSPLMRFLLPICFITVPHFFFFSCLSPYHFQLLDVQVCQRPFLAEPSPRHSREPIFISAFPSRVEIRLFALHSVFLSAFFFDPSKPSRTG